MIRSVLAVLAGIAVLTVAAFAIEAVTNPLLLRMFPQALPNEAAINQNLFSSLFGFLYGSFSIAAGGYATARIAQRSPVVHAIVMGVLELILTVMAMMDFRERAPLRNWIVTLILTVPAAWLGGVFSARKAKAQ